MTGRFRKLLLGLGILGTGGAAVFWLLTMPSVLTQADLPEHSADAARGRTMFLIGGCASCHAV